MQSIFSLERQPLSFIRVDDVDAVEPVVGLLAIEEVENKFHDTGLHFSDFS
jgi:hypothetical protein